MSARATTVSGRGQRSLLARILRAAAGVAFGAALAAAATVPVRAAQVVNTATATWGAAPARSVSSNTVSVQIFAAPRFGVAVTSAQPQSTPAETVRFDVVVQAGAAPAGPTPPYLLDGSPSTAAYVLAPVPAGATFFQASPNTTLYHWAGDPPNVLHTTPPPAGRQVDAIGVLLSQVPPNGALSFSLTVQPQNSPQVYQGGVVLQVQPTVNAGAAGGTVTVSPAATSRVTGAPSTLTLYSDSARQSAINALPIGRPGYLKLDAAACNDNSPAAVTRTATITTGNGDQEVVTVTQTAPGSSLFDVPTLPTQRAAAVPRDGRLESPASTTASVRIDGCYAPVGMAFELIDPRGVVFDSRTGTGVDGLVVSLYKASAGACTRELAQVFTYDPLGALASSPNPFLSAGNGQFEFPLVEAGFYCLGVQSTSQYAFPSKVPLAEMPPRRQLQPGSLGSPFQVGPDPAPVIVDLPVDSTAGQFALFVEKKAGGTTAVVGEQMDFTIRVKNTTPNALTGVQVSDSMSAGLSYVRGTLRIDGASAPEPATAPGSLGFALPDLAGGGMATITYRAAVGPMAQRTVRNSAAARAAGGLRSNVADVTLDVARGFETDSLGVLTGTVYLACRGTDAEGNPGVPGVTLLLEDGTSLITDKDGRFSRYGLRSATHVLKVDRSTLPDGASLVAADRRGLAMIDLKDGELFKRNFALECTPGVQEQVRARAQKLEQDEAFRVLDRVFAPTATLPAAGRGATPSVASSGSVGELSAATPAVAPGAALTGATGSRLGPLDEGAAAGALPGTLNADGRLAAPLPVGAAPPPPPVYPAAAATPLPLEQVVAGLTDARAAFLMPQDGQVLSSGVALVRVKAPAGSELELRVNGEPVPAKQVGKRSLLPERQLMALEYVAVPLRAGANKLSLHVRDAFGNARGGSELTVTAPGELARLVVEPVEQPLYAGETPYARVRIRAVDADGLPVTTRIPVQLEANGAQWALPSGELAARGQAFVENGGVELAVTRPVSPGRVNVDARVGTVHSTGVLDFQPRLRPLIGAGVVEGIVRFTGGQLHAVMPTSSLDAFSQELRGVSRELGADAQLGLRSAFYLKGKVKGDYLLTLSYDSDKTERERLFRDISPDEFYPVYGDSSVRLFDAQSVSKLYVRIDKGHNWLLVGDFMTQPSVGKGARPVLSAYNRPVNGAAGHYEQGAVSAEGFVIRDSTRQRVVEFAPNGTSGPYTLAAAGLLPNSEKVEILVRDRLNTNLVLGATPLTRFQDYELETLAGRILFSAPVAMFDANQNPQTIRVTFEVEGDGQAFTTAGGQVTVEVAPGTTVTGRMVRENDPDSPYTLQGVLAETQLTPTLKLTGEIARSSRTGEVSDTAKAPGEGAAARVELRGTVAGAEVAVTATVTSTGFENTSAGAPAGRRDVLATAAVPVNETTRAVAKLTYGEDVRTGGVQTAAYAGVETAVGQGTLLEAGVRVLRQSEEAAAVATPGAASAGAVDTTTLRIKATRQLASVPALSVSAEAEQAVDGEGRSVGLGANYQLSPSTKVYGRTELTNTLPVLASSAASRQATAIGIDTSYSASGRAYAELRETVSQGVTGPAAAFGVREGWEPYKGIRLTGGLERVQALGTPSTAVPDSMALTSSARIQVSDDWRANVRAERSVATGTQSNLFTSGIAYKFDEHWTGLARQAFFEQSTEGQADKVQSRVQLGAAWRSVRDDALMVLESRREPVEDGEKDSEIVSVQYGRALSTSLRASARIAGRFSRLRSGGLDTRSSAALAGVRLSWAVTTDASLGLSLQAVRGPQGQGFSLGTGIEAGYRVAEGLWVVAGYDWATLRDNILQGPGSARGAFIRIRYIFDETVLDIPPLQ